MAEILVTDCWVSADREGSDCHEIRFFLLQDLIDLFHVLIRQFLHDLLPPVLVIL